MSKNTQHISISKPLLLSCAISLALTACGGSGGDNNAPIQNQPQAPANPKIDNKMPPAASEKNKENKNNGSANNLGNTGNSNSTDTASPKGTPQNPANGIDVPMPSNPVKRNDGTRGLVFMNTSDRENKKALLRDFSNEFRVLNPLTIPANTINTIILRNNDLKVSFGYDTNSDLKLNLGDKQSAQIILKDSGKNPKEDITLTLDYTAKAFGYEEAQAIHSYGKIKNGEYEVPFDVAYSVGSRTSADYFKDLDPNAKISYQGYASFRAYENAADKLATGTAKFVVDIGKKAITDATIDLTQSIGKKYIFADENNKIFFTEDDIDKNNPGVRFSSSGFEDAANLDKALRGYFYGPEANHIGGVYYTPEGGGAFITEKKQP